VLPARQGGLYPQVASAIDDSTIAPMVETTNNARISLLFHFIWELLGTYTFVWLDVPRRTILSSGFRYSFSGQARRGTRVLEVQRTPSGGFGRRQQASEAILSGLQGKGEVGLWHRS
jgi:hypothetical protein